MRADTRARRDARRPSRGPAAHVFSPAAAPSVIMIDEIECIAQKRDKADSEQDKRICAQLLTLMDGLKPASGVVVLAATGKPNDLDPALRRFGRLDREVALEVPDEAARREILAVKTRGMALAGDVDLEEIARRTERFTGAELAGVIREAALAALREDEGAREVAKRHVDAAVRGANASLTEEDLRRWEAFAKR